MGRQRSNSLSKSPADVIISVLEQEKCGARVDLPVSIEQEVWDFVKDNPGNFEWEAK